MILEADGQALVDRTRCEVDNRCKRERYWNFEYLGRGITPARMGEALAIGIAYHDAITLVDPAQALITAEQYMRGWCKDNMIQDPFRLELPLLAAGMAYAFTSRVLKTALETRTVFGVEVECHFDRGKIRFMTKPDLILEDKNGDLEYWESKSVGTNTSTFCKVWEHKIQTHMGALAVQETLGRDIEKIVIQGAFKGGKYKGSFRSRLLGGYSRSDIGMPTKFSTKFKKGYGWFLANEHPEGQMGWIDSLPSDVFSEQFPYVPPQAPNIKFMDRWVTQRVRREEEILDARGLVSPAPDGAFRTAQEEALDRVFPQNDDACVGPFGTKCSFYECCWNKTVGKDPIGSGMFKLREPHHQPEVEALNLQGA